jgi:pyrimidine oxygenase
MDIGVFIPIGNNGWLISTTSPQYMPSFELNRQIVQKAEGYGLDFALSMIKLRGFGGESEFWDHNLESFTLMAGLAAVTERIRLYASVAVLTIPPAIIARMASTIDSISHGRFGVNIVSGWAKDEYEQMGLWPGEKYFGYRYDYSTEYVTVMKELWENRHVGLQGRVLPDVDCKLLPRPKADGVKIVCAGSKPARHGVRGDLLQLQLHPRQGRQHADRACADQPPAMLEAAAKTGRDVGNYVLMMVIADETDEKAMAKWKLYNEGADLGAMAWMSGQADADPNADAAARQAHLGARRCDQFQHGHAGRFLCQRGEDARRMRHRARHRRASC